MHLPQEIPIMQLPFCVSAIHCVSPQSHPLLGQLHLTSRSNSRVVGELSNQQAIAGIMDTRGVGSERDPLRSRIGPCSRPCVFFGLRSCFR